MPSKKPKQEVRVSFLGEQKSAVDRFGSLTALILIGIIIALVVFIGIASGFLALRTRNLNNTIIDTKGKISQVEKDLVASEKKIQDIGNIGYIIGFAKSELAKHVAGEQVLSVLESAAIPEVKIKQIAADMNGSIIISLRAKDTDAVARQIGAWEENENIRSADVGNVTAGFGQLGNVEGIDFSATLIMEPEVMVWQLN